MRASALRRLVIFVSAVVFLDTMLLAAVAPLLPSYADGLGLSKASAGILIAAYPAGVLLAALPAAALAARLGVRPTVVLGLCLIAAASLAFGLAESAAGLDASRLLQGVGGACAWAGGFGWLTSAAPSERRGEVIGAALGAAVAGSIVGPALGALAEAIEPAVAFGGVAALALLLALLALGVRRAPAEGRLGLSRGIFGSADLRLAQGAWLVALFGLVAGAVEVLAPLRLDALGWGAALVGGTFLVASAVQALMQPLAGRMSDRRGRWAPARICLVAAALILVALAWPTWAIVSALLVVALITAVGVLWTPGMALLSDGTEALGVSQAAGFSLANVTWSVGQLTGSAAGGAPAGATTDAVPYSLLAVLCALTVLGPWAGRSAQEKLREY